jgi:hypothetical protein
VAGLVKMIGGGEPTVPKTIYELGIPSDLASPKKLINLCGSLACGEMDLCIPNSSRDRTSQLAERHSLPRSLPDALLLTACSPGAVVP